MSSIGPQLPPSLQTSKRKRSDDEDENNDEYSSQPPSPKIPRKSRSPPDVSRPARVIGPTLPPASLDERPPDSPDSGRNINAGSKHHAPDPDSDADSDTDSDDGFGPALPSTSIPPKGAVSSASASRAPSPPPAQPQATRDSWMLVPPSNADWTSRVDPTKLKSRKFNMGKTARGGGGAGAGAGKVDDSMWHETPAQREERLRREILGIKDSGGSRTSSGKSTSNAAAAAGGGRGEQMSAEKARELREYTEKTRGPTLYASHQSSSAPREKDDDPSARAFDRDKDIGGGLKINSTQRRDLMKKAADFGTRFSSAKYLE